MEVHSRDGRVIWSCDAPTLAEAVSRAVAAEAPLLFADLSGVILDGIDLAHADLRWATLARSSLRGADLRSTRMDGVDLTGAVLDGATMTGASMGHARAPWMRAADANMRGVWAYGADLAGADLRANITGMHFGAAYLVGAIFRGAAFRADRITSLIARATRSDGHEFFAFGVEGNEVWKIKAGCRWMTFDEYVEHADSYPSAERRRETREILDYLHRMVSAHLIDRRRGT